MAVSKSSVLAPFLDLGMVVAGVFQGGIKRGGPVKGCAPFVAAPPRHKGGRVKISKLRLPPGRLARGVMQTSQLTQTYNMKCDAIWWPQSCRNSLRVSSVPAGFSRMSNRRWGEVSKEHWTNLWVPSL